MKKLAIVGSILLFIVLCLFLWLKFSNKKLVCNYKMDYEDIKIRNKIEFNFKDNTYKQVDKMIFKDKKSASNYFNDIKDYIEEYNLKLDNNTIISEIENTFDTEYTKKELKKQYEGYDYVCK